MKKLKKNNRLLLKAITFNQQKDLENQKCNIKIKNAITVLKDKIEKNLSANKTQLKRNEKQERKLNKMNSSFQKANIETIDVLESE